jgi:hypothetical protein
LDKSNTFDFYPKSFNHAFLPKPNFEAYSSNAKKVYEDDQDNLAEDGYQEPDHSSTFMEMIKDRAHAISTANDEEKT